MDPQQLVLLHVMARAPSPGRNPAIAPDPLDPSPSVEKVVETYAFPTREEAITFVIEQVREHGTKGRFYALQTANELQQTVQISETVGL